MAAADQLTGLTSLMNLIKGSSTKSTQKTKGTTTQKSDMTEEGMDRVLQKILSGPGGVKDISGAARGAGLYNSTTESQMLNDLAARASGELEERRAGTTTSTDQTTTLLQEQPGIGIGGMLGPMAAMSAAKPLLGGLSGLLGGDGAKAAQGTTAQAIGRTLTDSFGTNYIADGGVNALLGSGGIAAAPALSAAAGFGSAADFNPLTSAMSLGGEAGGGMLGGIGDFLGGIPGVGSFLSGLFGGDIEDRGPLSLAAPIMSGLMAAGPVGMLMAPVMSILGGAMSDISIVCTALQERGLLDKDEYKQGQAYLQKLPLATKVGYYYLFNPIAAKIRTGHKIWTAVCKPFAVQRTSLIARKIGWKRWVRYPLGTVTKVVGEPVCWAVGKYLLAMQTEADPIVTLT